MKKNIRKLSLDSKNNVTRIFGCQNHNYNMLKDYFKQLIMMVLDLPFISLFTSLLDGNNISDLYALLVHRNGDVDMIFYDYNFLDYETGEQYDFEGINIYHTTVDDKTIKEMISDCPYILAYENKNGSFKLVTADMM